jgi:hypothetical protein
VLTNEVPPWGMGCSRIGVKDDRPIHPLHANSSEKLIYPVSGEPNPSMALLGIVTVKPLSHCFSTLVYF